MNLDLPPDARVWIYPADRPLTRAEGATALANARTFVREWTAHNQHLTAGADLLHDRFLVLAVDESRAGASGCSIDSSVRFVRTLGAELGVDFFNRMIFSFRDAEGNVQSLPRAEFKERYSDGWLNGSTYVFDPLVKTVGELRENFEKPLAKSWHRRMV